MLGQIKNFKKGGHVLEQYLLYPACAYIAAHSRAPGRTESLSVLVLLLIMEASSSLYVLLLHVCKYLLLCVKDL